LPFLSLAAFTGVATADAPHAERAPRTTGTIARERQTEPVNAKTNPARQQVYRNAKTGHEETHAVVLDHRAPTVIAHDRYAQAFTPGYRTRHDWGQFRPQAGWLSSWGVTTWGSVGSVTCEAANETTAALYPVTASRAASGWSDTGVDAVLDQALDECAAETNAQQCAPATPSCSFAGP
jgi:hypothetical protein